MHTPLNELSLNLQEAIFAYLVANSSTKLNHIFEHLKHQGVLLQLDDNPEQNLFKTNFLVMNALFNLQKEVHTLGYTLSIDSIFITLNTYKTNQVETIKTPLANYYLDFTNFEIESHKIEALLTSFWQRDLAHQPASKSEIESALKTLGLTKKVTLKEVKRAWYKIALNYHPDKFYNGDDTHFKTANNAYKILTKHMKSKDRNDDKPGST